MVENPYRSPLTQGRETGNCIRWTPLALLAYLAAFTAWLGSIVFCLTEPPGGWYFDPLAILDAANAALVVAWFGTEACLIVDALGRADDPECA